MTGRARWPGLDVALPFAIVTLIWGSTWLVIRDQVSSVPPTWSVTYRFIIAALAMFGLALAQRRSLRIDRRELGLALFLGLFQFTLNFNFVYRSELYLTSGVVAVLYALLILPNSLLARIVFGQRANRAFLVGGLVSASGVALLFLHEYRAADIAPDKVLAGIAFGVAGLLSASVSNVAQMSKTARQASMMVLLAWAMLFGALFDAIIALALEGAPVFDPRPGFVAGTLWLALAGSVVTFPLYFRLIQKIGPGRAAYSSVAIPVIAMIFSTLFEAYDWSLLSAGGSLLALAGMGIALAGRSAPVERGEA